MTLKKTARSEVVSLRLNEERLELLERYRRAFAEELGREVSLSEAAFLALEDRAVGMDRTAARMELLKTPTGSLARIHKRWESQHSLSAVEWDVLAEYVCIGADEERQRNRMAVVPSRESYLALLDAFEAVYTHRLEPASRRTWAYFGNLDGFLTDVTLSPTDTEQQHQTVLTQIARRRALLQPTGPWDRPGNIGYIFRIAVMEESVDSKVLDQLLAPYWPVLWRLAARGHWIRHDRRPVPVTSSTGGDVPRPVNVPATFTADELSVSFRQTGGGEVHTAIEFVSRRFTLRISQYPELVEFRAMLDADDRGWLGRYYGMAVADDGSGTHHVAPGGRQMDFYVSAIEWTTLRDLFRLAWQSPELQRWLAALQVQYGEQG